MHEKVEEAQAALARKHLQQQEYVQKIENAENAKLVAEEELESAKIELDALKQRVNTEKEKRDKVSAKATTPVLKIFYLLFLSVIKDPKTS